MYIYIYGADGIQIAGVIRMSDAFVAQHEDEIVAIAKDEGFTVEAQPDTGGQPLDLDKDDLQLLRNCLATMNDPS